MCKKLFSGREKSSVGVWGDYDSEPWLDQLRAIVQFLQAHSVLVLAVSVDCWSLNLITYPVLVVPTPATCTSFVAFAFRRAFRIWMLAESVGRYLVKVSVAGLASSGLSCVLIRRQLGSLFGSSPFRC
jgi:hypothetical protein